ncbi:beta-1,4-galactosyltransferase 1-like [Acomys russatus]|uniref:beta-1,4-galactosyltransferase 1-like n=1 Tax=Acomys russatus TaxID=60746 RepID=UPI0021E27682|nr:beta-1,4-galactosyltransferase 1-like [Acomys russatus]
MRHPGGSTMKFPVTLHQTYSLFLALLCVLGLGAILFCYGEDLKLLSQQGHISKLLQGAASAQPSQELGPAPPSTSSSHPRQDPSLWSNLTVEQGLPACPQKSPLLTGFKWITFNIHVDLELLTRQNPELKMGGRYTPRDCVSAHKVAVVIPFRNREEHLKYWLYYLHPVLQRQQLDYGVYVVHQAGATIFNRAKLLNVGFREALKDYDYHCFVFSDVDIVPMDDRNDYRCFPQPRHISVALDKFGFSLPYHGYFGGVSALSKQQFLSINGFSNNYWGWGGEDDDIFNRIVYSGMSVSRPSTVIGRCRMMRHKIDLRNEPSPQRFERILHTNQTIHFDGLNSLSYRVLDKQRYPLYSKITVDIGVPRKRN